MNFNLPFKGTWLTFWGGNTKELNIHHDMAAQKHAYDFVKTNETNKAYQSDGLSNEDYFCFREDVLAPADGIVVEVVYGVRDNKPGDTNPYMATGNYALIKHSDEAFSFLAHLRLGSLIVKLGDSIKTGQKIGECGNSGNSSEPHLHYHLQNSFVFNHFGKNWKVEDVAKGVNVQFSKIVVGKGSKKTSHESYSPVKGDYVSNS